jgi:hypothetical protein
LIASDRAATGLPETVVPGGALIDCESGVSCRICVFSTIAGSSSNTNAPVKLLE